MATCAACGRIIMLTTYAGKPLMLDPEPLTYAAVDMGHDWPEDGMRVFRSFALVDHANICPAGRQEVPEEPVTKKAAPRPGNGRPPRMGIER